MSSLESRLHECFTTVFPEVPVSEIEATALEFTPQWDSMATVTLITVLEEGFAVTIDPNDFAKMTSYHSILEFLRTQNVTTAAERR